MRFVQKKPGLAIGQAPVLPHVAIMSHPETQAPDSLRTCIRPDYATSKNPVGAPEEATRSGESHQSHRVFGVPVTRGPSDVWHSEEYLIGWLVKTHGWRVISPGLMRRSWRPDQSATAPGGPLGPGSEARQQEAA